MRCWLDAADSGGIVSRAWLISRRMHSRSLNTSSLPESLNYCIWAEAMAGGNLDCYYPNDWVIPTKQPLWAVLLIAVVTLFLVAATLNQFAKMWGRRKQSTNPQEQDAKQQPASQELIQTGINNAPHNEFKPKFKPKIVVHANQKNKPSQQQKQNQTSIRPIPKIMLAILHSEDTILIVAS